MLLFLPRKNEIKIWIFSVRNLTSRGTFDKVNKLLMDFFVVVFLHTIPIGMMTKTTKSERNSCEKAHISSLIKFPSLPASDLYKKL